MTPRSPDSAGTPSEEGARKRRGRRRPAAGTVWRAAVVATALAVLAGCTRVTPLATNFSLGVVNGTTITVSLFVNGQHVADYGPGQSTPTFAATTLPSLPWTAEARSPSGRVLISQPVARGEIRVHSMTAGSIDLACGPLMIWVGEFSPPSSQPPGPTAEQPVPCN